MNTAAQFSIDLDYLVAWNGADKIIELAYADDGMFLGIGVWGVLAVEIRSMDAQTKAGIGQTIADAEPNWDACDDASERDGIHWDVLRYWVCPKRARVAQLAKVPRSQGQAASFSEGSENLCAFVAQGIF